MTRPYKAFWRSAAGILGWVVALLFAFTSLQAAAQTSVRDFDHLKTGYALTGVHVSQRCESCHVNGIFRGTPKDCVSCHTMGQRLARANTVKPAMHVKTDLGCEACHNTKSFGGAKFNHAGVADGSCASCHTGATAPGKPATHIPTQASCDACHNTTAWLPAKKIDHSGFTSATNCASCHDGKLATGKAATHIPAGSLNCLSCHTTTSWKPSNFNHTQVTVANQCSTCHSGSFPPARGKSATHTPFDKLSGVAIANCDTCHKGGTTSWTPSKFHANVSVSNQCATCHAKPTQHPATDNTCESCHKTSGWAGAKINHSTFTAATNCASCHDGKGATGKAATHIPAGSLNCLSCHTTTSWKPSNFNHTQVTVANQCSTCHSGSFPPARGKSATHTPFDKLSGVAIANCDTCHKGGTTSWTPSKFHANVSVSNQCATCHPAATRLRWASPTRRSTTA